MGCHELIVVKAPIGMGAVRTEMPQVLFEWPDQPPPDELIFPDRDRRKPLVLISIPASHVA